MNNLITIFNIKYVQKLSYDRRYVIKKQFLT